MEFTNIKLEPYSTGNSGKLKDGCKALQSCANVKTSNGYGGRKIQYRQAVSILRDESVTPLVVGGELTRLTSRTQQHA